jgi:hypothetical protein
MYKRVLNKVMAFNDAIIWKIEKTEIKKSQRDFLIKRMEKNNNIIKFLQKKLYA